MKNCVFIFKIRVSECCVPKLKLSTYVVARTFTHTHTHTSTHINRVHSNAHKAEITSQFIEFMAIFLRSRFFTFATQSRHTHTYDSFFAVVAAAVASVFRWRALVLCTKEIPAH